MVQLLWRTVGWFVAKQNIASPYGSAIELLGIYPKDSKLKSTEKPAHTSIVALFIIAKTFK